MRFIFLLIYSMLNCFVFAQSKVNSVQLLYSSKNKEYHINDTFDLKGDTLRLSSGCTLNFDGGAIKNGVVLAPFNGKVVLKGNYLKNEAKYFGDFYTDKGEQLTYKLDTIKRNFNVYHPFAPSYPIKDGIEAYHLSGSQGVFIIYHLSNVVKGKTTDNIVLNGDDQKYVKDDISEITNKMIRPLIANRVNVIGLMFHTEGNWNDSYYSSKLAKNYQRYILDKVDLFKSYFPMMRIIYISNEQPWFAPTKEPWNKSKFIAIPKVKRYKKGWEKCLLSLTDKIHSRGLETGFKFANYDDGVSSVIQMNKQLLEKTNYLSVNFYPWSGDINKKNLFNKWQMDFYSKGLLSFVETLKSVGKSQPISLSEIGILPYRESLPSPWQYKERKMHDDNVVRIHIETVRRILSYMPCKTDFIVYWFLGAINKDIGVTTKTMQEVYDSFLK